MEKFVVITYLFDFYQELLTDKQRDLVKEYYFEDLSLGELSEQHQISRQSVFDTIKKAEQKLLDYEKKLNLFSRHQEQQQTLVKLRELCHSLKDEDGCSHIKNLNEVAALVDELINKI